MKVSRYAMCALFTAVLLASASSFAQLDSTSVSTPISAPVGDTLGQSNSSFATTTSTEIETGASNLLNPDVRDTSTMDSTGADVSVTAVDPSLERAVTIQPVLALPDTYGQQDALLLTGARPFMLPRLFSVLPPTRPVHTPEALAFSPVTLPVSRFNSTAFRMSATTMNSSSFDPGAKAREAFSAPAWRQSPSIAGNGMPADLPEGRMNMPPVQQNFSEQQGSQGPQNRSLSLKQQQLTGQSGLSPKYAARNLPTATMGVSNQSTPGGVNWSGWNTWPGNSVLSGASLFNLNTLGDGNIFAPDIFSSRAKGNTRNIGTSNQIRIAREQANRISRFSETGSVDARTLERLNREDTLFPRATRSQKQLRRSRYHNPLLNDDASSQPTPDPQY